MARFEKINKFKDVDIQMPKRKTECSAGYDMVAAEDVVIPPYTELMNSLYFEQIYGEGKTVIPTTIKKLHDSNEKIFTLDEMASLTKQVKAKPTLVSTGMKCKLDPNTYLELSVRSSSPLKYWILMANSVGIIDADYYNNPDNEGEIFFQLINLSPFPIKIQKGEAIGQGIIKHYLTTEDDDATGMREGGFGSTGK